MINADDVVTHYSRGELTGRLRTALQAAGLDDGPLTLDQLAPLDQFHARGLAATIDLATALAPEAGARVLDVGSGLGGPSRYLAAAHGCDVTGVDLSLSYVEAARFLADRVGLGARVHYRQADALSLPFEDRSFDIAWTQHVAMNIGDRSGLYAEIHRVVRPGGRLAIYDVLAGDRDPLVYPVPWSRSPETSFLMKPDEMRRLLEGRGFQVDSWIDRTADGAAWFADLPGRQATVPDGPSPLGLHVVMGPDFKLMSANLGRNLKEGRALLIEAVLTRL